MKYATSRTKATRQTESTSPRHSSAGQEAVSIVPPEYGIDFVDSGMADTIQKKENNTGLPDKLKTGIETLSDLSMDDVSVHYNSAKPAQLQALAYTQGTDIHMGPGQERHLPHEAWHVVQQKQGRVKPTMQIKGTAINDDARLENEANMMGRRANAVQAYRHPKRDFRALDHSSQHERHQILPKVNDAVVQRKTLAEAGEGGVLETNDNKYALTEKNRRILYGKDDAARPEPQGRFPQTDSDYEHFVKSYENGDDDKKSKDYLGDCQAYALSLDLGTFEPGKTLIKKEEVKTELVEKEGSPTIGNIYWFKPEGEKLTSKQGFVKDPANLAERIYKGATPYHFAYVVAMDGSDVITSEVNAAFYPSTRKPWFAMYKGKGGFFKAFDVEYTSIVQGEEEKPKVYRYKYSPEKE